MNTAGWDKAWTNLVTDVELWSRRSCRLWTNLYAFGSLQWVAIKAEAEATKLSELSMERSQGDAASM